MPEYGTPGLFVEETNFRSKSIEGASTSTTGFVGPTRSGPVGEVADVITSAAEFERVYGRHADLACAPFTNYIAHSVGAYFEEGGKRLYVARVAGASLCAASADLSANGTSRFVSRFPGAAGNGSAAIGIHGANASLVRANAALDGSVLRVGGEAVFVKRDGSWIDSAGVTKILGAVDEAAGLQVIRLRVVLTDADGGFAVYDELGLDPADRAYIGTVLKDHPERRADRHVQHFAFVVSDVVSAFDLLAAVAPDVGSRVKTVHLTGGTDAAPTLADYTAALNLLAGIEEISIVASPGHTELEAIAENVGRELIAHVDRAGVYRVAVLDVPANQDIAGAQAYRGRIDSKNAALYYPWVVVADPDAGADAPGAASRLALPPAGFIAGIYARTDVARGVWKSPANEVVRSAVGFERQVTHGEQEILNPLGVNCLREFPGRGHRVWGARITSSDAEARYVAVRRYLLYLQHSIDRGTRWAVFEPNAESLWANVRSVVEAFLHNEWAIGALLGATPGDAFFVKCDRSTMTQNDLDNGRLICVVGVALVKPAEFLIFRISQPTAGAA